MHYGCYEAAEAGRYHAARQSTSVDMCRVISLLLKAVAAEFKSPTVLGYCPNDAVRHSARDISVNFECDGH